MLTAAWGATDYETRTIFVNARASDQAETLLHELMHVALQHEDMTREEEHRIIEMLSPKLWPLLEACGVQWPARPKR